MSLTRSHDSVVSLEAPRAPEAAAVTVPGDSARVLGLRPRLLPLLLAAAVLIVFSPSLFNEFVHWDDNVNIVDNPHFRGLGWAQIRWMFTTGLMGHYIPVTWLTLGLDYTLWGMDPAGYHLTSLLLHAANVVLVYVIARHLLAKATPFTGGTLALAAAVAAGAFGLHPLRVESVAWVTERRDVLSGFFFLLTVLGYLKAGEARGRRRRWLLTGSVAAYALALGSKSIVMTLPLVLLLLDVYPLRRVRLEWGTLRWATLRGSLLEKLPYALLAVVVGGVAYYMVRSQAYLTPFELYPWSARIAMAAYSLWFYVSRTAFPLGLSPLYELPAHVDPLAPRFLFPALAVAGISAAALALRHRWPAGLAVWAYYGIVLAPVSGIVHSGHQLAHDRYSYLSCLGFALLLGAGVGSLLRAQARGALRTPIARLAATGVLAALVGLGAQTWGQTKTWRDSDTLWRWAVQMDGNCSVCLNNLGATLSNQGYGWLGRNYYERALAVRPDKLMKPRFNMAIVMLVRGEFAEASEHYQAILNSHPDDLRALNGLAMMLIRRGHPEQALEPLERALRKKPDDAESHSTMGIALADLGRSDEAIEHFQRAIALAPLAPEPRLWLTRTYLTLEQPDAAREEFVRLARLSPTMAEQLRPAFMGR